MARLGVTFQKNTLKVSYWPQQRVQSQLGLRADLASWTNAEGGSIYLSIYLLASPQNCQVIGAISPFNLACWALLGLCLFPTLPATGAHWFYWPWEAFLDNTWRTKLIALLSLKDCFPGQSVQSIGVSGRSQQMPGTPHQSALWLCEARREQSLELP